MSVTGIDRGFRYIVDVDGLLLGFEQSVVDKAVLLSRAGVSRDRGLIRLVGEQSFEIPAGQAVSLSEDDVVFFRSTPLAGVWPSGALAA